MVSFIRALIPLKRAPPSRCNHTKTLPPNAITVRVRVPPYEFGGTQCIMEKEMATHSSVLAWRIPWTEESGGLQFMGSQRVGHD